METYLVYSFLKSSKNLFINFFILACKEFSSSVEEDVREDITLAVVRSTILTSNKANDLDIKLTCAVSI